MTPSDDQHFTGNTLIVEGAIIGFLGSNILTFNTGWKWDWIFDAALGLLFCLYLIRTASTLIENPNISRIRRTTPWSTIFLQICIVGAAANAAIKISKLYPMLDDLLLNFVILTGLGVIAVVVIDETFFGEIIHTWIDIINENSGDNHVGEQLRTAASWVQEALDATGNEPNQVSFNYRRGFILIGILGTLFLLVLSPFLYLSASILGSTWIAFLVLFVLMLVRDITRYLYLQFGPARNFNDVKTTTSMSMLVILLNILLVAGSLGLPF